MYEAFQNHWDVVASHADNNMKNYEYTVNNVGDSIMAFFFPRRKAGQWDGNNTVTEILDKLDKSGYANDTMRVLMSG